ncbi:hypothetical protein [Mucilaginibacter sp. FT3.2]|uniref:hypothetical protein n=1 Tax=Mucilaginibacter sp. FT3.2 TaxID=2723090 RepID=UPI001609A886|nr:hypothetical protein [Mucilaginibacter sp. FT3.2]MBB6232661.1 hypothetical protein [Mucilaginibacter sp. FT3.2]
MKNYIKRHSAFVCFLLIVLGGSNTKVWAQKLEKAAFYKAMASDNIEEINQELATFTDAGTDTKTGYDGALLMKKASLVGKPKDKLSFFKAGRIKLETALLAEPGNTDLHFLRLVIQEKAPKIVHYRADIEKDKTLIIKNFKGLQPVVQQAIVDYSKTSKVLHTEDLKAAE